MSRGRGGGAGSRSQGQKRVIGALQDDLDFTFREQQAMIKVDRPPPMYPAITMPVMRTSGPQLVMARSFDTFRDRARSSVFYVTRTPDRRPPYSCARIPGDLADRYRRATSTVEFTTPPSRRKMSRSVSYEDGKDPMSSPRPARPRRRSRQASFSESIEELAGNKSAAVQQQQQHRGSVAAAGEREREAGEEDDDDEESELEEDEEDYNDYAQTYGSDRSAQDSEDD